MYRGRKNVFDQKDIVTVSKPEAMRKIIDHSAIMDFLPQITPHDIPILESWKQHFKDRGVPFAITRRKDNPRELVLWKECMT